jgi:hypothetical protein
MERKIYSSIVRTLGNHPDIDELTLVVIVSSTTECPLPKVHEQLGQLLQIGVLKRQEETDTILVTKSWH